MSRQLYRCWVSVAITLLACTPAGADAVTDWNKFAVPLITSTGRPPNATTIDAAYMHIAIYDAINAIEGGYTPFAVAQSNVPPGASSVAAAAAAAYVILSRLYPSLQAQIDAEYANALAKAPSGQARADGIAVGKAAANGLLARRGFPSDGWNANVPYTFQPAGPGVYQKTPGPPPTFAYAGPVTPWQAKFKPFAILKPAQFRAAPPPALSSKRWARDFNEVKEFGALNGSVRTPQQTEIGLFYGLINAAVQIGRNLVTLAEQQQLTLADDGRFFAQEYVTMADALVGCWDSKYFYNFWRPVTAIRAADIDGNPATQPDPTWLPQITTPGHPEYPSAHGCVTGAYADAIAHFFGTEHLSITLTGATGHPDRTFDSTEDIIEEIVNARVYNGVHYRTSVIRGAALAHNVAKWVAKRHFRPVESDDEKDSDDSKSRNRRDPK
jgi:hypothetical protein